MTALDASDWDVLSELSPVLRRAVTLDPRGLARIRLGAEAASVLVRLPFDVLVSRTIATPVRDRPVDVTVAAAEALAWLDGERADPPESRDAEWRTGLPPATGWRRIELVPDDVVRGLVRSGALAVKAAAEREGVPGAQPRAEVADALLDSAVLTVSDDAGSSAAVSLRALSALTRMGFLPRGGETAVDVAGRWIRVVAEYGTVYIERPGGLVLR
ncbi:MAG: hypothetical protein QOG01_1779 [Pseudonocardiales bacterium]|jgi:hypothetical protein|nr:hypothetical protein [Pseudonocardiales bacterium]